MALYFLLMCQAPGYNQISLKVVISRRGDDVLVLGIYECSDFEIRR